MTGGQFMVSLSYTSNGGQRDRGSRDLMPGMATEKSNRSGGSSRELPRWGGRWGLEGAPGMAAGEGPPPPPRTTPGIERSRQDSRAGAGIERGRRGLRAGMDDRGLASTSSDTRSCLVRLRLTHNNDGIARV